MINVLAIVGAGAGGTCMLRNITQKTYRQFTKVVLIDPLPPARGIAFEASTPELICNTSVGVNSLVAGDQSHFLRWLRLRNHSELSKWGLSYSELHLGAFIPRGLFQHYVRSQLDETVAALIDGGIAVEHIEASVETIESEDDVFKITLSSGANLTSGVVIVSAGLSKSRPIEGLYPQDEHYLESPYASQNYRSFLGGSKKCLVLGSRQSAIDAAFLVHEADPTQKIAFMSPSGSLPSVRGELVEHRNAYFNRSNLKRLQNSPSSKLKHIWSRLIERDLRRLYGGEFKRFLTSERQSFGCPVKQLESDLKSYYSGRCGWQYMVGEAIVAINAAAVSTPPDVFEETIDIFSDLNKRYVSAIPYINAEKLLKLFKTGTLTIFQGPQSIEKTSAGFVVIGTDGSRGFFDRIINATGMLAGGNTIRVDSKPLFDSSRAIDRKTLQLRRRPDLYVIGPSLGNALPILNYMRATTLQAQLVANSLARQHQYQTA